MTEERDISHRGDRDRHRGRNAPSANKSSNKKEIDKESDSDSQPPSPYNAVGWAAARILPAVSVIAGIVGLAWARKASPGASDGLLISLMFLAMGFAYFFFLISRPDVIQEGFKVCLSIKRMRRRFKNTNK